MTAPLTHIPGKDAALEESIAALESRFTALGFRLEERSWLNPVSGAWSVHLRDTDCGLIYTNGKGASLLAARASALGEFAERLSCRYFWNHFHLGATLAAAEWVLDPRERWFPLCKSKRWPAGLLDPQLRALYDPDGSIPAATLVDHHSGANTRGICALPYRRLRDDETIWFPANLIGNLFVSNGMAAGNNAAEARAQALSEILERHVKYQVIREGLCLPDIPDAVIARHPGIAQGIAELRAAGFGVLVKDASLGGRYPVACVTLLNPRDQGCFASFGAHPNFAIALERALTELLQGRGLDKMDGFPPPVLDLDEAASATNLESHFIDSDGVLHWRFFADTPDHAFTAWSFGGDSQADYAWLCDCIHAEGRDIYVADFEQHGVYACRILVPGLSEIYPLDDLEWENNSAGNAVRQDVARLPDLSAEECAALLARLDELGQDDMRPVAALIGLAPDPGSHWESLRVGELRLLLALAAGDHEQATEFSQWVGQIDALPGAHAALYRCVHALLGLAPEDQGETALCLLFGERTLLTARRMLAGEDCFASLGKLGQDFEASRLHQALLAAYRKTR